MQFDTGVAAGVHPGAMGYAMPYGKAGTRIHILLDRVLGAGSQRLAGVLLGHVMAHELGHVLEGISRHSDSGLMKAHWDDHDFDQHRRVPQCEFWKYGRQTGHGEAAAPSQANFLFARDSARKLKSRQSLSLSAIVGEFDAPAAFTISKVRGRAQRGA
jgi:hypothetical protein